MGPDRGTAGYDYGNGVVVGTSATGENIYLALEQDESTRVLVQYSPGGPGVIETWSRDLGGWNFFPMTVYQADASTHFVYVGIGDDSGDTLAKLDSSNVVKWQRAVDAGSLYVWDLAADSTGVYATGAWLWDLTDFDPDPQKSAYVYPDPVDYEGFIWKLDHDGNFLAARRFGTPNSYYYESNYGFGIAVHNNDIYTTGSFNLTIAEFDTGTQYVSPGQAENWEKMFVLKTTQDRSGVFGQVFNDLNNNGVRDTFSDPGDPSDVFPEPGIAGVTVSLGSGLEVGTQKYGQYVVNHLVPGSYTAAVVLPTEWTQTFPTNPVSHSLRLQAGQFADTCDFGLHRATHFRNYVSTDVPKRFPNRSILAAESTLTIADSYAIFDVEINITVSAKPTSLDLRLIAPDGAATYVTAGTRRPEVRCTSPRSTTRMSRAHGL